MKYIFICAALFLISGCAQKTSRIKSVTSSQIETKKIDFIKGFSDISQDVSFYTYEINKGYISSLDSYVKMYFKPWNISTMDIVLEDAMWAYKVFDATNSYGENLQLLDESFFRKIKQNSNFEAYSTLNRRAITLKKLNIRTFPTDKPVLRNPDKAGEGFPFDYM